MPLKVLIIKVSALGDIIHALPVLEYLHAVSPGVEVDWVVEEPFRDVLEGNPLIRRLMFVRTKMWRKRPFAADTRDEIAALKAAFRETTYDLVFDIQGNLKSGLICWLSGAEHRIGFEKDVLQEKVNLLFTTRQIPLRKCDAHITDQYLRLVSVPFGKDYREMSLGTDIHTSPEDELAAETLLATLDDGLTFLFHQGTTWATKYWTTEGWIELGKRVLGQYDHSTILLSWGNERERKVVTQIAAGIGSGARLIDRYSLKGLTAVLKKVDVVVGGDTGPVHLAAAVGTPTVSLYRASNGRRSGPRGSRHAIIQSPLHCAGCFRTECDKDAECRASITVEAVMSGIETVLSPQQ